MGGILPHQFETYWMLIVTGQIPDEEVPKLLDENPDFARWYQERQGLSHAEASAVLAAA